MGWLSTDSDAARLEPSTLPVGDARRTWATRSRNSSSIFVWQRARAPHAYFAATKRGPQGREVPFGGARQGPGRRLRTAVSSADRAESLGLYIGRGVSSSPHTVPLCLGVRGPGIAELCSVASRVASGAAGHRGPLPELRAAGATGRAGLAGAIVAAERAACRGHGRATAARRRQRRRTGCGAAEGGDAQG